MNYIKRLEKELRLARVEMTGLRCGLSDLKSYLSSSKFHQHTTVQVGDIFNRLAEAENLAQQLFNEQDEIEARNERTVA